MSSQNLVEYGIDYVGLETLSVISKTVNFNNWMYQSIKPFIKGNVLEIGSGIGNITQYIINDKFKVTASDIRTDYCDILQNKFGKNQCLNAVKNIDIVHPDFNHQYKDLFSKFDTIIALNTIEHIENDLLAIKNCRKFLFENGNLIILVPANPALYNSFDKELKHFRRYTKAALENLFIKAGYKIQKTQYFNSIGVLGWWFSGNVLRNKTIQEGQMKLFDFMVPAFKIADKIVMNRAGLSLIVFGVKE